MTDNAREMWEDDQGAQIKVRILRRYLTLEDVCPECEGGLRIAVGKALDSGEQVFRLECVACAWVTEALPDPDA